MFSRSYNRNSHLNNWIRSTEVQLIELWLRADSNEWVHIIRILLYVDSCKSMHFNLLMIHSSERQLVRTQIHYNPRLVWYDRFWNIFEIFHRSAGTFYSNIVSIIARVVNLTISRRIDACRHVEIDAMQLQIAKLLNRSKDKETRRKAKKVTKERSVTPLS